MGDAEFMAGFTCNECDLAWPHDHTHSTAPDGGLRPTVIYRVKDPRAEVRDPETGEVIFPATKGPLGVIYGGKFGT